MPTGFFAIEAIVLCKLRTYAMLISEGTASAATAAPTAVAGGTSVPSVRLVSATEGGCLRAQVKDPSARSSYVPVLRALGGVRGGRHAHEDGVPGHRSDGHRADRHSWCGGDRLLAHGSESRPLGSGSRSWSWSWSWSCCCWSSGSPVTPVLLGVIGGGWCAAWIAKRLTVRFYRLPRVRVDF